MDIVLVESLKKLEQLKTTESENDLSTIKLRIVIMYTKLIGTVILHNIPIN